MKRVSMTIRVFLMSAAICFIATETKAVQIFDDGETHNIDYAIIDEHVRVDYEAPGVQTTLNLQDGGSLTEGYGLTAYSDSRVNISGGTVGGSVNAVGNSCVSLSAGSIELGFFGWGYSQITMTGGTVNGTSGVGYFTWR